MGTHGFSENLYPYPPKTRTHDQGYGFAGVRVRVEAEIPQGYPWHSLDMSLPRSNSHGSQLREGSDMDMPEPICPDVAIPNHTSPHSESDFSNMPIDHHSALPSSPLSNPVSDSN